jgi:hypothetical protein
MMMRLVTGPFVAAYSVLELGAAHSGVRCA